MSKASGQIRLSQAVMTFGPGALIDLPEHSAIVGGLDFWPSPGRLRKIAEPRLTAKLAGITGVHHPELYEPPPDSAAEPGRVAPGITAWKFPEWFLVLEEGSGESTEKGRRLVSARHLDRGRFRDGDRRIPVVPVRFVKACPRGHVEDIDWHRFVHGPEDTCRRQLRMSESGTSGDLSELSIRCECGKSRRLYEATALEEKPLGFCNGKRPWLGSFGSDEDCQEKGRLLIRTASNAYFSQTVTVLSLPDRRTVVDTVVEELWSHLEIAETAEDIVRERRKQAVGPKLASYSDAEVLEAVQRKLHGGESGASVKEAEIQALLAVEEGYGDDVPINQDFHARKLPKTVWQKTSLTDGIDCVVQVHRLREVVALAGFTRFDPILPDIHGEYENVENRAEIAMEPSWFPAVENRGEGILLAFRRSAVEEWLSREGVQERLKVLAAGHDKWQEERRGHGRDFPGGIYTLLHTVSHLLIQSLAMRCGYPASSIRERIYAEEAGLGILLYTASPDAEGTLGGLVQQARHLEDHLGTMLEMGRLCSNDPICSQHAAGASLEGRHLHGAACHGCSLIAETCCEIRNEYLDRALVVETLDVQDAAFFRTVR